MALHTIELLKNKYSYFAYPCYTFKINGREINRKYCQGELRVELTADYEASSCTIKIPDAFDERLNKTYLKNDMDGQAQVGNTIDVYVGYMDGGVSLVFSGYIDSVYVDYEVGEKMILTLECLDGKGIMMNSLRSETSISINKNSEAIESVLNKYISVMKTPVGAIDKTDHLRDNQIEQHNESDYNFVVRLARQNNYCFFVEKGDVKCKPFSSLSKIEQFEFSINEYMLAFSMSCNMKSLASSVTVRGLNEKIPTAEFEATVYTADSLVDSFSASPKVSSLISAKVTRNYVDYGVTSLVQARNLAQAKMNELTSSMYSGKVKTVGLPELFPGYVASVVGFGTEFDNKYFINKVTHVIRNNNFTTECELEGNRK